MWWKLHIMLYIRIRFIWSRWGNWSRRSRWIYCINCFLWFNRLRFILRYMWCMWLIFILKLFFYFISLFLFICFGSKGFNLLWYDNFIYFKSIWDYGMEPFYEIKLRYNFLALRSQQTFRPRYCWIPTIW